MKRSDRSNIHRGASKSDSGARCSTFSKLGVMALFVVAFVYMNVMMSHHAIAKGEISDSLTKLDHFSKSLPGLRGGGAAKSPTLQPTAKPTTKPTAKPKAKPTAKPSTKPTFKSTTKPSPAPTPALAAVSEPKAATAPVTSTGVSHVPVREAGEAAAPPINLRTFREELSAPKVGKGKGDDDILVSSIASVRDRYVQKNESLHRSSLAFSMYANQTALKGAPLSKASLGKAKMLHLLASNGTKDGGKKHVAYVVTVTKDEANLDGVLVLGFSALKAHGLDGGGSSSGVNSDFNVDLIALVSPGTSSSRHILESYGWTVVEKPLPVEEDEIDNHKFAKQLMTAGKMGKWNLLRLWCFTFLRYHRVVHMDADSALLMNIDHLFMEDREIMYTGDYALKSRSKVAPAQVGFLVFKPSMERFEEFRKLLRKGQHGRLGWYDSRVGNFWGGQSLAGLIPYVYGVLHTGKGKEIHRCKYNLIADDPYRAGTSKCHDGENKCPDCRKASVSEAKTIHFKVCGAPWGCQNRKNPKNAQVCEEMDAAWFQLRDDYEKTLGIDLSYRVKATAKNTSLGMCKGFGDVQYMPIPLTKIEEHLLE